MVYLLLYYEANLCCTKISKIYSQLNTKRLVARMKIYLYVTMYSSREQSQVDNGCHIVNVR